MWSLPYEGYVEFMLPYGAWIRLFRAHGFTVEDLVELRPGPEAVSSYRDQTDQGVVQAVAGRTDLEGASRRLGDCAFWCRPWPAVDRSSAVDTWPITSL